MAWEHCMLGDLDPALLLETQAVSELLARGETGITIREIFEGLPDHVEQDGTLVTLRQWHDSSLRDLCFRRA
jgi:hypothetical protein